MDANREQILIQLDASCWRLMGHGFTTAAMRMKVPQFFMQHL
jgi:hypothetical protein